MASDEIVSAISTAVEGQALTRAIFSNPRDPAAELRRVTVKPVSLRGARRYQLEYLRGKQTTHRNLPAAQAVEELVTLLESAFRDALLQTGDGELRVHVNRRGEMALTRSRARSQTPNASAPDRPLVHQQIPASKAQPDRARPRRAGREPTVGLDDEGNAASAASGVVADRTTVPVCEGRTQAALPAHDRPKHRLIPEGQPCDFLARLGVMTPDGRVIAARYDKFRQVNHFLAILEAAADALPPEGPLTILDFGAGKGYLTFALRYYFGTVRPREARIIGLDLKADVVAAGNRIAADLGYDNLRFEQGEIASYHGVERADMVVALHACDTATDDALLQALRWQASVILAAPCCQHELYTQLRNDRMRPLLKHGLLKERFAALLTDAARAQLLEARGYDVALLEFVDAEHTPKNLLIRATRRAHAGDIATARREYRELAGFWGITPKLARDLDGLEPSQ